MSDDDSGVSFEYMANNVIEIDLPTFVLTLLSDDWLFFKDEQIAWDVKHEVPEMVNNIKADHHVSLCA